MSVVKAEIYGMIPRSEILEKYRVGLAAVEQWKTTVEHSSARWGPKGLSFSEIRQLAFHEGYVRALLEVLDHDLTDRPDPPQ